MRHDATQYNKRNVLITSERKIEIFAISNSFGTSFPIIPNSWYFWKYNFIKVYISYNFRYIFHTSLFNISESAWPARCTFCCTRSHDSPPALCSITKHKLCNIKSGYNIIAIQWGKIMHVCYTYISRLSKNNKRSKRTQILNKSFKGDIPSQLWSCVLTKFCAIKVFSM